MQLKLTRVLLGRAAASPMVEDGDLGHNVVKVGVLVAHVREVLTADLRTEQEVRRSSKKEIRKRREKRIMCATRCM